MPETMDRILPGSAETHDRISPPTCLMPSKTPEKKWTPAETMEPKKPAIRPGRLVKNETTFESPSLTKFTTALIAEEMNDLIWFQWEMTSATTIPSGPSMMPTSNCQWPLMKSITSETAPLSQLKTVFATLATAWKAPLTMLRKVSLCL